MKLDDRRLLEHKSAEANIAKIEELLALGRAARRRRGVRMTVGTLHGILLVERARLEGTEPAGDASAV